MYVSTPYDWNDKLTQACLSFCLSIFWILPRQRGACHAAAPRDTCLPSWPSSRSPCCRGTPGCAPCWAQRCARRRCAPVPPPSQPAASRRQSSPAVLRIRIHMFLGLPDPDPHVFWPPGSGSESASQRFGSGSGSGSGSFYHYAKIVRKSLIPTFL